MNGWMFRGTAVFIGVVVCALGVYLFGTLPVPSRVDSLPVTKKLETFSRMRTVYPYDVIREPSDGRNESPVFQSFERAGMRIASPVDTSSPPGLVHAAIGAYPVSVQLLRGFLASETRATTIQNQHKAELAASGYLNGSVYLFPRRSESIACQIKIFEGNTGRMIFESGVQSPTEADVPSLSDTRSLWTQIRLRFFPDSVLNVGTIQKFRVGFSSIPRELHVKVTAEANSSLPAAGDQCLYIIGNLSYQSPAKYPLAKRGILFVVNDQLRQQTAYDGNVMPVLNQWMREKAVRFQQHRANSNMTVPSMISLLTSKYPREVNEVAFSYAPDVTARKEFANRNLMTLPHLLRNEGYRVGAIGNISLFTDALQGGLDLGFHDAQIIETMHYETPQITNAAVRWLEENGQAPFFLYLHYFTMHGPYRSPLRDLDFLSVLKRPFGLSLEQEHYKGLARYFDREFEKLLDSLERLGIRDEIDIVFTSDHGAQMDLQPYGNFWNIKAGTRAASRDKGHGLSDEEVLVPFAYQGLQKGPGIVQLPTMHADVLPTVWKAVESRSVSLEKIAPRGMVLGTVQKPRSIYLEGHRYSGVLYPSDNPFQYKKYVRQLGWDSADLISGDAFFKQKQTWYEPEQFYNVDLASGESWRSSVSGGEILAGRKQWISHVPLQSKWKATSLSETDVLLTLTDRTIRLKKGASVVLSREEMLMASEENRTLKYALCTPVRLVSLEDAMHLLNQNCSFFPPDIQLLKRNLNGHEQVILLESVFTEMKPEPLLGRGAGDALKRALEDWGYAQ